MENKSKERRQKEESIQKPCKNSINPTIKKESCSGTFVSTEKLKQHYGNIGQKKILNIIEQEQGRH